LRALTTARLQGQTVTRRSVEEGSVHSTSLRFDHSCQIETGNGDTAGDPTLAAPATDDGSEIGEQPGIAPPRVADHLQNAVLDHLLLVQQHARGSRKMIACSYSLESSVSSIPNLVFDQGVRNWTTSSRLAVLSSVSELETTENKEERRERYETDTVTSGGVTDG
jgi:hypothetical protein